MQPVVNLHLHHAYLGTMGNKAISRQTDKSFAGKHISGNMAVLGTVIERIHHPVIEEPLIRCKNPVSAGTLADHP